MLLFFVMQVYKLFMDTKEQPELTPFGTSDVAGTVEGQDSDCKCYGMQICCFVSVYF